MKLVYSGSRCASLLCMSGMAISSNNLSDEIRHLIVIPWDHIMLGQVSQRSATFTHSPAGVPGDRARIFVMRVDGSNLLDSAHGNTTGGGLSPFRDDFSTDVGRGAQAYLNRVMTGPSIESAGHQTTCLLRSLLRRTRHVC